MKTPSKAAADIGTRLAARWHLTAAGHDDDGWPARIPLGPPGKTALETGFETARTWARDWEDWAAARDVTLDWANRTVRGTIQQMPTHLLVPDAGTAARLCGPDWTRRLARGRARAATLRREFALDTPEKIIRAADAKDDTDFALLLAAGHWFARHEAAGLTPRQVPLPGFHAKWLDSNEPLVRILAGKDDLGLIRRPARIHFTYLDPDHRAGRARRHDSLTIGDMSAPAYEPDTVLILENKDTALYFPQIPGVIAVEGDGRKAAGVLAAVPWVRSCPRVIYWGDIDSAGLEIVNDLRKTGVRARTILMDYAAYETYEQYGARTDEKGRPLPCRPRRNLPLLTPGEELMYLHLTDPDWDRARRVEQERIPFDAALRELARAGDEEESTAAVTALAP